MKLIRFLKALKILREYRNAPPVDKPIDKIFAAERLLNEERFHQNYLNFCKLPIAKKVFTAERQLQEIQADMDYLRSLPKNSMGYKFAEFLDFHPDIYIGYQIENFYKSWESYLDTPEKRLYTARMLATHDFVHLLIGYPRMYLGEIHAAAFHSSLNQNANKAFKTLLIAGTIRMFTETRSLKSFIYMIRSIREAIKLGDKLPFFPTIPWEDYMHLPIEEVQRKIGFSEEYIKQFKKTQERFKTVHYNILKAEHDALTKKQRELLCSGPNNAEIQRLVAPTI